MQQINAKAKSANLIEQQNVMGLFDSSKRAGQHFVRAFQFTRKRKQMDEAIETETEDDGLGTEREVIRWLAEKTYLQRPCTVEKLHKAIDGGMEV